MVKINFKSDSPVTFASEVEDVKQIEKEFTKKEKSSQIDNNIDLSFESTESFFPRADVEREPETKTELPEFEEAPRARAEEKPVDRSITPNKEFYPGPPSSQKRIYIIFGAAAALLLVIIFFIFQFMKSGAEKPAVSGTESETSTSQSPAISQGIMPVYQTNVASNNFLDARLQDFFAKKPASADYSLIVMTPTEINLTVLGDSRDQIAQFTVDLKKAFPALAFHLVSVQNKYEDGNQLIYADLSTPISSRQIASPVSKISVDIQPKDIKKELTGLAQKNQVNLPYFKQGKIIDHNGYQETLYYVNLSGQKDNIMKFLSGVISAYPMIRINKLSIFPYNLQTISGQNLSTRLTLSYYNTK